MPTLPKPSRWTPTESIEPDPDVVLAFHGLMCMCNHNDGFCEVGILNTDRGRHDLRIFIFEVSSQFDPPANLHLGDYTLVDKFGLDHTGEAFTDIVSFDTIRPRIPGVSFFLPPGAPKQNPNDFRFILDLEGPDFYHGHELGKKHAAMGPRLHINDAVFYTLCKTATKFRAQEGTSTPRDIDSIARIVGANIYLDRSNPNPGKVYLMIGNGPPIPLPTTRGRKNLVFIDNSCPLSTCRLNESDFPHYFNAVKVPVGRQRFDVKKVQPRPGGPDSTTGPCNENFLAELESMFAGEDVKEFRATTDDTPCGPAGNGSSGSLGPDA